MDNTLVSLFERNEQQFRNELSELLLPRDSKKLQSFLNDFFVNKVSVDEYRKELSMNEIAMLNSVLKVVKFPITFVRDFTPTKNTDNHKSESKAVSGQTILNTFDLTTISTTAAGGILGGVLFKTWGGVLLSIAGCALGMYFSTSKPRHVQKENVNKSIDTDKYINTLKSICEGIDEVILNYHTSIENILIQQTNTPKATLSTAYRPLLERLASLYVAIEKTTLPDDIKAEFDKLYRTLKNHHYEILSYNHSTKEYFIETPSAHVDKNTVVKAAILEDGKLLDTGECLIPEN